MKFIQSTRNNVRLAACLAVLILAVCAPPPAAAASRIVVGLGTPDSCNDAALRNALVIAHTEGGGTIRFQCGPAPVTINLLVVDHQGPDVVIPNNTAIDGGGLVTIELEVAPFGASVQINRDTNVVLRNLTFVNHGLRIAIVNAGTLTVANVTFSQVFTQAIRNDGMLFVKNSTFADGGNFLTAYAAIDNQGTASVHHSAFLRNRGSPGAINNAGTLEINNSLFFNNVADFGTGAIESSGALTIDDSEFSHNTAGFGIGAIGGGLLIVRNSTFTDNGSTIAGLGAIAISGGMIVNCQFLENHSPSDGGAVATSGPLIIHNSTFSLNFARRRGGAILTSNALTITHSTITENIALGDGGGIYVAGNIVPTLDRTSVIGNTPDDIVVVPPATAVTTITIQ
jgi:predicted outer membrane repeat protein